MAQRQGPIGRGGTACTPVTRFFSARRMPASEHPPRNEQAVKVGSGSIFVLLRRPVSRTRALLTKYAVAAALSLLLCSLCGCMALAVAG